jgi:hypothetical protein
VCGTYVVHLAGNPIEMFPQTAKIHRTISAGLVVLAVVLASMMIVIRPAIFSNTMFASLNVLYQNLQTDERFFTVGVNDNRVYSNQGKTIHLLQVNVWCKGKLSTEQTTIVMRDVARVVLEHADNVDQYDLLRIGVTSAYDLGIASGNFTINDGEPIDVWRGRVTGSGT